MLSDDVSHHETPTMLKKLYLSLSRTLSLLLLLEENKDRQIPLHDAHWQKYIWVSLEN